MFVSKVFRQRKLTAHRMDRTTTTTPTIFLTGITGTVGSWLAAEGLRRGGRVLALVRDVPAAQARARVSHALAAAGAPAAGAEVELVPGDLCQADFDAPLRERLQAVRLIIHCAGCVEFTETADGLLRRSNVEGTRRMLRLAETLRLPLVHVSTAYVAGRHGGLSTEDALPAPPGFNNAYEQTKHEAEAMVRAWGRRTGLPLIILRPSILLGDSERGGTARFNTVYDFMRAFERLAPALGRGVLRVEGEPVATKNIIPLDYFARAAWHIIERGEPGCYHLTHPAPLRLAELRDIFARLFGLEGIRLVDEGHFRHHPQTQPERIYQRAVAIYQPYLHREPVFDRARTDAALAGSGLQPPPLDFAYFERLLAYARAARWGQGQAATVRPAAPPPRRRGVERYFGEFLADKIGRQLLPELRKVTASVGIILSDHPGGVPWVLEIRDGALQAVSRGGAAAQCAYRLDTRTFGQIVSGRMEPQRAFFERRVELEGDLETGLRLAFILGAFFKQHAFEIGEDAA